MPEEKKCSYCAMMIPKEAKICPHCRKKMPLKVSTLIITAFVIFGIGTCMVMTTPTPMPRTPPIDSDTASATHEQIYRQYEICMNEANKTLNDDKIKGQNDVVICFAQLQKYGAKETKKTFKEYLEFYHLYLINLVYCLKSYLLKIKITQVQKRLETASKMLGFGL